MSDTAARRTRPISSVLDVLRTRIDLAEFDLATFALEAVVADLGYGDVRPLAGSVAWIDHLREAGKRTAIVFSGENAAGALALAGIEDRFDAVAGHDREEGPLARVLADLSCPADRSIVVDTAAAGITAAVGAGCHLALALARGAASPEALRRAGADAVVADLQELLPPR